MRQMQKLETPIKEKIRLNKRNKQSMPQEPTQNQIILHLDTGEKVVQTSLKALSPQAGVSTNGPS